MKPKFVIVRVEDIRKYLTAEQIKQFTDIMQRIKAGRSQEQKEEDVLVALNMRDQYAVIAAEAYMRAVRGDPTAEMDSGCEQAVTAIMNARSAGIMAGQLRKPKPAP